MKSMGMIGQEAVMKSIVSWPWQECSSRTYGLIISIGINPKAKPYFLPNLTLLEKGPWVSAGNPLLVSTRLADTIYRI
jgi:hypothetical protein